jgi:CubicO group peptidase (beta-lactamase class C family)
MRLVCVGLAAALVWAQPDLARIDTLAAESMKAWQVPGAVVGIVKDGQVMYAKGYGVKTLGQPGAVTARTLFAVGSTTKAFTTAAMAMLVDEKKMDWDDPVRRHLPEFNLSDPLANELVTLRDLVAHRTGLSRNDLLWYGAPWGRDEILARVAKVPLTKPFRSTWQYQNIMYLAAGQAVARVEGKSWEEVLRARILTPLGMQATNFTTADAERDIDHATPHVKRKGKVETTTWRNLDNIGPAGSINSSLDDMLRWLRFQMTSPVVRETHQPQMVVRDMGRNLTDETNQITYGLGWFLQDYRGRHVVSHGGAIDGFRASVTMLPKEGYGIVVMSNLGNDNMPEALRWRIVDHLLGLTPKDWDAFLIAARDKAQAAEDKAKRDAEAKRAKGTQPSRPLADYAGEFTHPAYGKLIIAAANGQLTAQWSAFAAPLEHWHYDQFIIREGSLEGMVEFRLNAAARVSGVRLIGQDFTRAK